MANGPGTPAAGEKKIKAMREKARQRRKEMLGMTQSPPTAGQARFGEIDVEGLRERARAASNVDPGVRAWMDDLGAERDSVMAEAREKYGPGGFNVLKQLSPAEKAEALARVQRRQALLRGGGR